MRAIRISTRPIPDRLARVPAQPIVPLPDAPIEYPPPHEEEEPDYVPDQEEQPAPGVPAEPERAPPTPQPEPALPGVRLAGRR